MNINSGNLRVLVVEDEPLIRMDVMECVSDAGMESIEAANADEALEILRGQPGIDIVFTDVNMPGSLDGIQLARMISKEWPSTGVIVTSGLVRPAREVMASNAMFFAKPYDLDQVIAAMKALAV